MIDNFEDFERTQVIGSLSDTNNNEEDMRNISSLSLKSYFLKALLLMSIVFLVCLTIPLMPIPLIALCWAILSVIPALGIAFPWIKRKLIKRTEYQEGGRISRFYNGRILCLIVSYILGAILMGGLFISICSWGVPEWIIDLAGIPLYLGVFMIIERFLKNEVKPTFKKARTILLATIITGLIMCISYAIICAILPPENFTNAYEAYKHAINPFNNSHSVLFTEIGKIIAMLDSMSAFGLSKIASHSLIVFIIFKSIVFGSTFFGITSILGVCSMNIEDVKDIFSDLNNSNSRANTHDRRIIKRALLTSFILPVVFFGLIMGANSYTASKVSEEQQSFADQLVDKCVKVVVYLIDNVPYDKYQCDEINNLAEEKSQELSEAAKQELTPLINQACDAMLANVDNYLEWYFSIPADYEIILAQINNEGENFLTSKLEEGIDDAQLQEAIQNYNSQVETLKNEIEEKYENARIYDVPEKNILPIQTISMDDMMKKLKVTQKITDAKHRLEASAAAGIGSGIIAKQLTSKLMDKVFFKKLAAKISSQLSTKAAGAAIGGAVGSIVPVVGNIVGFTAGLAAGVAVDFGLVQLDRLQNYDKYKEEIITSIEESRTEMLASVQL